MGKPPVRRLTADTQHPEVPKPDLASTDLTQFPIIDVGWWTAWAGGGWWVGAGGDIRVTYRVPKPDLTILVSLCEEATNRSCINRVLGPGKHLKVSKGQVPKPDL